MLPSPMCMGILCVVKLMSISLYILDLCKVLALKFYRNLASKLSAIFFAISGNLMSACLVRMFQQQYQAASQAGAQPHAPGTLTSSSSSSSVSSDKSSSSTDSTPSSPSMSHQSSFSVTPARTIVQCPNVPQASVEVAKRRRRLSKRRSINLSHAAYKGVLSPESDSSLCLCLPLVQCTRWKAMGRVSGRVG